MDDLIRRQDAIDALWKELQQLDDYMDECLKKGLTALRAGTKAERNRIEEDIEIIKELHSVQPTVEPKKGHWIATHERTPFSHPYSITYVCSECGNKVYTLMGFPQTTEYCWKCGAHMRGENNG